MYEGYDLTRVIPGPITNACMGRLCETPDLVERQARGLVQHLAIPAPRYADLKRSRDNHTVEPKWRRIQNPEVGTKKGDWKCHGPAVSADTVPTSKELVSSDWESAALLETAMSSS